jgi:membrane-bound lytic murein transglycosylase MltF
MALLRDVRSNTSVTPVRDYPEIRSEGILRFMTEYSKTGYFIEGDSLIGFQYELSRAIADVSGLEVQTEVETKLSESFAALDDERCDVIAHNLPITSELKQKYLFTDPIIMDRQVLVQRTADANGGKEPLRDQLQLSGVTIHVAEGSPALYRLRNMEEELADTIHIIEDGNYSSELLMFAVAKGEIDYTVCDWKTATAMRDSLPEIDIATDIGFTQLQAWAVRKTSPVLLDSLNSWLEQLRDEGSFNRIIGRYYR